MAGTAYMPPLAEWLYLQICVYNWDKGEALPISQVAMRFSRSASWQGDLQTLIESGKVKTTEAGDLFVERAIVEANKAFDLWERKSRGGKSRGAGAKDEESIKSHGKTPDGNQSQSQSQNQSQSPLDGDTPLNPPAPFPSFEVPFAVLQDLRNHRAALKAPMTRHAEKLVINVLKRIYEERGHDPAAVIYQTIRNGWRSVRPLVDPTSEL
jgi:hypothetical protein